MKSELNNENIHKNLEALSKFLEGKKFSSQEIIKCVLLTEEILLKYQNNFGPNTLFEVKMMSFFGSSRIVLKIYTDSYDYRNLDGDEEEILLTNLLASVQNNPSWSYRGGCNCITIITGRKPILPEGVKVLLAVVFSGITYFLVNLLPTDAAILISDTVIPKASTVILAVLKMIAGLLIFFTIIVSIAKLGNLETLKKTLGKILSRVFLNDIFMILTAAGILALFCDFGEGSSKLNFENIYGLFIDMIPTDVFSPFVNGSMVQISLLAIAFSILMVIMGDNAAGTIQFAETMQQMTELAMRSFCRILPVLVYLNVYTVFTSLDDFSFENIIMPTVGGLLILFLLMLIETTETCIIHKISVKNFIRTALPGTIIAMSTASTSAALEKNSDDLRNMGVESSFIKFIFPIEQVFYKPCHVLTTFAALIAAYRTFDIALSTEGLINICIFVFVIVLACPSVPGAMLSCLTMLVTQLALPNESMGILVLFATLFDYFGSGLSIYSISSEITGLAYRWGKMEIRDADQ